VNPAGDPRVLFVTVSDDAFFPGTLAAVASVRRFHPRAGIVVVDNNRDKPGLRTAQRRRLDALEARVMEAAAFGAPGRKLAAWELKTYVACDLSGTCDLLVGFDSDLMLCGPVDDVAREALATGNFFGGRDGEGVRYDASYAPYGFPVPARNGKHMSTSLYFCATTPRNRHVLERWAHFTGRAKYNGMGDCPGHGDQGILDAVLFKELGPEGVTLLPNNLWSQHWTYWRDEIVFVDGRFVNRSDGSRPQRAFHCTAGEKCWEIEHVNRIRAGASRQAVPYGWFLFLLFFAGPPDFTLRPTDWLPRASWHLVSDLFAFFDRVSAFAPDEVAAKWPRLRPLLGG
jgi:hypothetical protein